MMPSYKINEIYDTIQGEGLQKGRRIILVRFAECNLTCSYCDTEFDSFEWMSLDDIARMARGLSSTCRSLLLTGGEPLLQLDDAFIDYFHARGYWLGLETSGSLREKFTRNLEWVTCSPKVKQIKLHCDVDEVRVPCLEGLDVEPYLRIPAKVYYVSPIFDEDDRVVPSNLEYAFKMMDAYPQLRLSVQMHKLINMP